MTEKMTEKLKTYALHSDVLGLADGKCEMREDASGNWIRVNKLKKLLESCNPEDDIILKDKIFDKKIRVGFKVGYVTLKDKLLALLEDKKEEVEK